MLHRHKCVAKEDKAYNDCLAGCKKRLKNGASAKDVQCCIDNCEKNHNIGLGLCTARFVRDALISAVVTSEVVKPAAGAVVNKMTLTTTSAPYDAFGMPILFNAAR